MELGVHQKKHCLCKMQNTYAAFILTTKTISINKTRSRSKKTLYFCLLMWNPKIYTTAKHSKKSIHRITQLQRLEHKPRNLIMAQRQEIKYTMILKEHHP